MIDVHSHITFGLDDGAATLGDSIRMAKEAVKEGIQIIVATPHHRHPNYDNSRDSVLANVKLLNEKFTASNIPLKVLAGQEVRLFGELHMELDADGELLTINNSRYVLIEFPSSNIPSYSEQIIYEVLLRGYIPVIAHPERNAEIVENPDKLYRLVKNGALSQVTTSSVAGAFGKKIQKRSLQFIEYGLSQLIASDAHNTTNRSFKWQAAFHAIDRTCGKDVSLMLKNNAEDVIADFSLYNAPPERVPKQKFLGLF